MKVSEIFLDATPTPSAFASDSLALRYNVELERVEAVKWDGTRAPFGNPSITQGTPVTGVKAAVTVDPTGTNNNVTYTAVGAGTRYNTISVRYVISGSGSAVISVVVANSVITITAGSATTAQSVINAVNADARASKFVVATASGTVSGTIAAAGPSTLTGGVNCTPAKKGEQRFDVSFTYLATTDLEITSTTGWRKTAHSAL